VTLFKVYFIGFTCLLLGLLITGCSSVSLSETRYYLLNNQQPIKQNMAIVDTSISMKKMVVLSINDLPEYLTQPYLVMQMADHQLHYARFHMWAEPLQQGLKKVLLADLNNESSTTYFMAKNNNIQQDNVPTLFVNVDYFHASSHSKVMLSGQYWLSKPGEVKQMIGKPFYFELRLEQDGYPHSVAKSRGLISKLAEQIVKQSSLEIKN